MCQDGASQVRTAALLPGHKSYVPVTLCNYCTCTFRAAGLTLRPVVRRVPSTESTATQLVARPRACSAAGVTVPRCLTRTLTRTHPTRAPNRCSRVCASSPCNPRACHAPAIPLPTRDNEIKNRTIGDLAPISAPTGVFLTASRPNSSRYAHFFR